MYYAKPTKDTAQVGDTNRAGAKSPDKSPATNDGSSFNQILGIKGAKQESISISLINCIQRSSMSNRRKSRLLMIKDENVDNDLIFKLSDHLTSRSSSKKDFIPRLFSLYLDKRKKYIHSEVIQLLSSFEKELRPPVDRIRKFVENLKSLSEGLTQTPKVEMGDSELLNPRRNLEEEYLDFEAKYEDENDTIDRSLLRSPLDATSAIDRSLEVYILLS